jgi:hypothetical protein
MSASQSELFSTPSRASEHPNDEIVGIIRARLRATLELVRSADQMPWTDQLAIIREDNAFRYDKDVLPAAEGAALWAAFNVEMDRLYAITNEGKVPDPGD